MSYAVVSSFTGATKTTRKIGNVWYDIYVFGASGSITFSQAGDVDYALVGGGGPGGHRGFHQGGGGGGGEVSDGTTSVLAATLPVNIGQGGVPSSTETAYGTNGSPTTFNGISAGGGAAGGNGTSNSNGASALGGGGGAGRNESGSGSVGTSTGGGGNGGLANTNNGGAGGGDGGNASGLDGGAGRETSILGIPVAFGGGGSGGDRFNSFPVGNTRAGGGRGQRNSVQLAFSGQPNTGGGGGGAASQTVQGNSTPPAGAGGNGIAILRVTTPLNQIPVLTIREPFLDLPLGLSGGADLWDSSGIAGQILRDEWFAPVASLPAITGSASGVLPLGGFASGEVTPIVLGSVASGSVAASGDLVLNLAPLGLVEGDVVVIFSSGTGNDNLPPGSVPAGYTSRANGLLTFDASDLNWYVATKRMGPIPDTTVNFGPVGSADRALVGRAVALRNVNADMLDGIQFSQQTNLPFPPFAGYTPANQNSRVLVFFASTAITGGLHTNSALNGFQSFWQAGTVDVTNSFGHTTGPSGSPVNMGSLSGGGTPTSTDASVSVAIGFRTSIGAAPAAISGQSSGTLPLTGSASGTVRVTGQSSGSLPLTGAATGAVRVAGSASGSLPLTGSATGAVRNAGAGAGAVPLSGSGVGSVRVTGSAAGVVDFAGSGQGNQGAGAGIGGTAAGTLPLTGSATGNVRVAGQAAGALGFAGSGSGQVRVTGLGSGVVPFGGAASGITPARGAGAGNLNFVGAGQGRVVSRGQAAGGLSFVGEATGRVLVRGTATSVLALLGSGEGFATNEGWLTVFNGTSFVKKPVRIWTVNGWETRQAKVWNGTSWVAA